MVKLSTLCNYDTNYFRDIPLFYKKILEFFNELKTLYSHDQKQELILFNNKDILVDGKPIFLNEWFKKIFYRLTIYGMKVAMF